MAASSCAPFAPEPRLTKLHPSRSRRPSRRSRPPRPAAAAAPIVKRGPGRPRKTPLPVVPPTLKARGGRRKAAAATEPGQSSRHCFFFGRVRTTGSSSGASMSPSRSMAQGSTSTYRRSGAGSRGIYRFGHRAAVAPRGSRAWPPSSTPSAMLRPPPVHPHMLRRACGFKLADDGSRCCRRADPSAWARDRAAAIGSGGDRASGKSGPGAACRSMPLTGTRSGRRPSATPRYYGRVRLLRPVHHRLRPPAFPARSRDRHPGRAGNLPVPAREACAHARVFDDAEPGRLSR